LKNTLEICKKAYQQPLNSAATVLVVGLCDELEKSFLYLFLVWEGKTAAFKKTRLFVWFE